MPIKPIRIVFFIYLSLVFFTNTVLADVNKKTQRKLFLSAEKQVWQANSLKYQNLYQQLANYPLQPYLDQKRLMHRIRLKDAKQIDNFLDKYKGSPLDWPLRKKWLQYLAKRQRKWMFLNYYRPNGDVELNCYFRRYQLDTGTPAQVVLPQVTKLWLVGKSQPKVCDPLFKQWQKAGYRTANVVWQRISLAAKGGKHTLIPYLTKLLPKNQQVFARLWHKVRRDPAYIKYLSKFPKKSAKSTEILSYGFKRLIWRDPQRALRLYEQAKQKFTFSVKQKQNITKKFAQALASKNHKKARLWLSKIEDPQLNDSLVQWRLVDILKQQDWSLIKQELRKLPIEYHHKLQWKYWYARSLLKTNEQQLGKTLLNRVAQKRHYYGFLAASYLNQPLNIQDHPLFFNESEKLALLKNSAAKRAFELFYLKRYNQARREWHYWLSTLSNNEKLIAAKIAHDKGWYDRAIFTLAKQGYLDDISLRFPQAYQKNINYYAKINKISPHWAAAIARRESSFMSDAHSSAGAYGLMQIMPNTAKHLLRREVTPYYLLQAKNNIKLGTKYLRQLFKRQHNNVVLATASYNAGPYRVNSWIKNKQKLPADIWIETIPYKETRDYVKSVLAYQQIYQVRAQQKQSLFKQIINMEIGK